MPSACVKEIRAHEPIIYSSFNRCIKDKLKVVHHNNKDMLESENNLKLIDKSSNVASSLLKMVKYNCHDQMIDV